MNIKRLVRVKDNRRNGFVGVQGFTYDELKHAFDKLKDLVYGSQESDFEYYFEIEGEYDTKTKRDCFWNADFDYNSVAKTIEGISEIIESGYLDVYYQVDDDPTWEDWEHGIVIEHGKIKSVY